jgi:UDPglucose 6-dehydrogenase
MRISIIGAGYVGLTTAVCLAEIGHDVFCADSDEQKLALLRKGGVPFYEPHLDAALERAHSAGRLRFTDAVEAIKSSEVVFICVGTPPLENGEADLSAIESVAHSIVKHADGYRLIVDKSTVPVQTAQQLRKHFHHYNKPGLNYDVASNPEFLREGSAVEDSLHPDRIVIGIDGERPVAIFRQIYAPILEHSFRCPIHQQQCPARKVPFIVTDTNSAELIKHASNAFLATKISFINMVADLCEVAGADVSRVAEGMGLDPRIGPAFLRPGIGFGGFCFPKDLQAFVRIAENFGCDFSLLKEVEKINLRRADQVVSKLKKELWVLSGKTVAVWGIAFKPDTDDIRFAPSLVIIRRLLAERVTIRAYDPKAIDKAKVELPDLTYCRDMYDAANGADAILLLTEWQEFRGADWDRLRELTRRPLLLDGRNMFASDELVKHGFVHIGVGRNVASPTPVMNVTA